MNGECKIINIIFNSPSPDKQPTTALLIPDGVTCMEWKGSRLLLSEFPLVKIRTMNYSVVRLYWSAGWSPASGFYS